VYATVAWSQDVVATIKLCYYGHTYHFMYLRRNIIFLILTPVSNELLYAPIIRSLCVKAEETSWQLSLLPMIIYTSTAHPFLITLISASAILCIFLLVRTVHVIRKKDKKIEKI